MIATAILLELHVKQNPVYEKSPIVLKVIISPKELRGIFNIVLTGYQILYFSLIKESTFQ